MVAHPSPPQIRTHRVTVSGSSSPDFATRLNALWTTRAAGGCTASPGVRNPSTTKALHGYVARASASRFSRLPQEFLETGEAPGDSVIPEVAFHFLTELLVLLRDRLVQVFTTPVR